MRILHILDHSIPLHSGYTFQDALHSQGTACSGMGDLPPDWVKTGKLQRTGRGCRRMAFLSHTGAQGLGAKLPVLNQVAVIDSLTRRLSEVAQIVKPDILHAHSPVLNALPALRVGRRLGIPVVYEIRAFWEDAAVDHGTSREWGIRYRLTRDWRVTP